MIRTTRSLSSSSRLPKTSGYEVARQLREIPALKQTTIVAMTGYGMPADRQRGREAGFDHHLVKPVDHVRFGQLVASIESYWLKLNRQPVVAGAS